MCRSCRGKSNKKSYSRTTLRVKLCHLFPPPPPSKLQTNWFMNDLLGCPKDQIPCLSNRFYSCLTNILHFCLKTNISHLFQCTTTHNISLMIFNLMRSFLFKRNLVLLWVVCNENKNKFMFDQYVLENILIVFV